MAERSHRAHQLLTAAGSRLRASPNGLLPLTADLIADAVDNGIPRSSTDRPHAEILNTE